MATYACSDLHGRYDLWTKIKEYLKDDDILIFIGDAADRGRDGWKIIKELLMDKRVIYIRGNHEEMLIDALIRSNNYNAVSLYWYNGGQYTFLDASDDPAMPTIKNKLRQLPLYYIIENINGKILFSHSGSDNIENKDDLLWNKRHVHTPAINADYVIHGHIPIPLLVEELGIEMPDDVTGSLRYSKNKIDIDAGAVWTDKTILLNVDTFEDILLEV